MEPGGCRLTCCVGSDSIVFGYNISKEDTPEGRSLNLVVLSFADIVNHPRYDADDNPPVPPCKPSIVLHDIISPTIINTDTKLILLHRNGHVTSLDFVNIRREQRNQMFDDAFKIEKNDKIFKIPEMKPPKKSRGELAKMMEDRFAEVSKKEEVREAEAEAAREAVRQNERRDSIRHSTLTTVFSGFYRGTVPRVPCCIFVMTNIQFRDNSAISALRSVFIVVIFQI